MTEKQEDLVKSNIPLMYFVAKGWSNRVGLEFDDIVSLCQIGIVKAALKFNPKFGIKFSTYAVTVMNNEVKQELRRNKSILNTVSMELPVDGTEDIAIKDMLSDNKDCFSYLFMESIFNDFVGVLTENEHKAVMVKIRNPDATQTECGNMLGISQSLYSRRIKSAKKKLKDLIKKGE